MKVLDLFSGIGGFSLGLERAGMETVAFCEIEDYPVSILNKHWPDIPVARDVRKLTYKNGVLYYDEKEIYQGTIDIICGGFPCQPFSVAGKQRGIEDDRHLWPEMLRIIKEVRPAWVIGENVAGFIRMALDDVLLDMETEGYAAQSFVIPACAAGAIHRRDRVWIIGCAEHAGRTTAEIRQSDSQENDADKKREKETCESERSGCQRCNAADTKSKFGDGISVDRKPCKPQESESGNNYSEIAYTNTDNEGLQRTPASEYAESEKQEAVEQSVRLRYLYRREFKTIGLPTQSPVRHRNDGVPDRLARLKALGNAVVPQIPELIGRYIVKAEKEND